MSEIVENIIILSYNNNRNLSSVRWKIDSFSQQLVCIGGGYFWVRRKRIMALIKCPECGREVSDIADLCPNCGCPIRAKKKKLPIKKILLVLMIVIAIIGCITTVILSNRLDEQEQMSVDQVSDAITEIGEVSLSSESKITKAEKLYAGLSDKCQRHVENREELSESRKTYDNLRAEETINQIKKIGTVKLTSKRLIDKAQKLYDALSDEQKKLVSNAEDLFAAVDQLSVLQVENVESKISSIKKITLESREKIVNARLAYDNLSENDKSKVSKYNDLLQAEADYDKLAVDTCISLIDSIGEVTLDSKSKIEEAQELYDLLSKETRDKITNYSVLKSARAEHRRLLKEEEDQKKTINPGDTFSTDKWEVTYLRTDITTKILPNDTSGYYLYYYSSDDGIFVDNIFQIKNIDTDILSIKLIAGNCEIDYDGTKFTKICNLYTSRGSDINSIYLWDGLDALTSTTLHVATEMPRELQTNDKSVTVRLEIAGEEKIIRVR